MSWAIDHGVYAPFFNLGEYGAEADELIFEQERDDMRETDGCFFRLAARASSLPVSLRQEFCTKHLLLKFLRNQQ
ncbi:hypothetical protein BLA27_14905 [Brucella cytisi]|uniref:Uncharacterized protein n=1 Tax=Brucella cytisi TaxID=407152 RepID=A0A1J6HWX5_9HYPH|nr:hypothetical protein BLA27_14905 [Brucella cytisi]